MNTYFKREFLNNFIIIIKMKIARAEKKEEMEEKYLK